VFLGNHPLTLVTTPPNGAPCDWQLHRPYRGLNRIDWTGVEIDPGGVEFNRSISDWMALFARIGFAVERYEELYAPETATGVHFSQPADWAKLYPSEQVWVLRRP